MSPVKTSRTTPYASYVFSNVASCVRSGAGLYSYDELAEMVGLKPTHNFRKRIKQMVEEGLLTACAAFTPRGGIETRFMSPTDETTKEIPF